MKEGWQEVRWKKIAEEEEKIKTKGGTAGKKSDVEREVLGKEMVLRYGGGER